MKQAQNSDPHHRHRQPTLQTHLAGVRAIAFAEAVKGVFGLLLSVAFLHLLHRDVGEWAENMVYNLHLDPDHWLARIFMSKASGMTDNQLALLALGFLAYACIRFTEAYGLWYRRPWAEWFAVISGSLYMPYEIYEILRKMTALRWAVFLGNIVIIVYLLYIRMKSDEERKAIALKEQQQAQIQGEMANHRA